MGWEDFALFPILSLRFVGSCFSDGRFKFFRLVCRFTNRAHLIFVRIVPKGPQLATVRSKDHKELPRALGDKTEFVIELEQLASVLPVRLQRSLVLWQKHITQENPSRVSQEDDRSMHEVPDALYRVLFQQQSLAAMRSSRNQRGLSSWWTALLTPVEPTLQFRPSSEAPVLSMWQRDLTESIGPNGVPKTAGSCIDDEPAFFTTNNRSTCATTFSQKQTGLASSKSPMKPTKCSATRSGRSFDQPAPVECPRQQLQMHELTCLTVAPVQEISLHPAAAQSAMIERRMVILELDHLRSSCLARFLTHLVGSNQKSQSGHNAVSAVQKSRTRSRNTSHLHKV